MALEVFTEMLEGTRRGAKERAKEHRALQEQYKKHAENKAREDKKELENKRKKEAQQFREYVNNLGGWFRTRRDMDKYLRSAESDGASDTEQCRKRCYTVSALTRSLTPSSVTSDSIPRCGRR